MNGIYILIFISAIMFAVVGGITIVSHIYNLNNIKSKTVGDGQHGTARFSTKAELRRIFSPDITKKGFSAFLDTRDARIGTMESVPENSP